MIHLDTNYLIGLLVKDSPLAEQVARWLGSGQDIAASAIAWTEFLNGPVTPVAVAHAEAVLQGRILPFARAESILAAELFNKTGRRRGTRFDCLIAATAVLADAELATVNEADFKDFARYGLKLTDAPSRPSLQA